MDLGRDKFQENIIKDIIRNNDDNVTSLFLKKSGEGDEQNRRDGSDEVEGASEGGVAGEGEGAGSNEGEADGSDRTLNITKTSEVDVY
jgi:hypothetical protein